MKKYKPPAVWIRFFNFILRPATNKSSNRFVKNVSELLLLFLFGFALRLIISFLTPYLVTTPMREDSSHHEFDIKFVFIICLLSPIVEEIAFRLPLVFSKINLSLSATVLSFFIVNRFFNLEDHFDIHDYFFLRVAIAIFLGLLVWLTIVINKKIIVDFYNKRLGVLVYSYGFLFAFMHIANHGTSTNYLLSSILIMLPHFISSLILSFTRLNYGFSYALFLHVVNNLVPFLILSAIYI